MGRFELAERYIVEQSWWIASELCRRNSSLELVFAGMGEGFYRGPEVRDPSRPGPHVFFNQAGRIHLHPHGSSSELQPIPFLDGVADMNPHSIVNRIEHKMGWKRASAAPTTARSLTYRVLSAVLTTNLNHRDVWGVSDGRGAADLFKPPSVPDHFEEFEGASQIVATDDALTFWAVTRDGRTVALLDGRARLYRRIGPPRELLPVYRRRRRIRDAIAPVLDEAD